MLRWMGGEGDPLELSDYEGAGQGKDWLGGKIYEGSDFSPLYSQCPGFSGWGVQEMFVE